MFLNLQVFETGTQLDTAHKTYDRSITKKLKNIRTLPVALVAIEYTGVVSTIGIT